MRAIGPVIVVTATVLALVAVPASGEPCPARTLVLGAMPLEVHPFLRTGDFDPAATVRNGTRTFFVGRLGSRDVVLAMTGIGMTNAQQTVTAAAALFGCGLDAVIFSGVAGSRRAIGEVAVPERWSFDGGDSWLLADPGLLASARSIADGVALDRFVPVGDDACLCPGVDTIPTSIDLGFDPQVWVGGNGTSGDTLDGIPMPCVPGGGDVFGCQACLEPGATAADVANFAANPPSQEFLRRFLQYPEATTDSDESQDMESAAAAAAAADAGLPFIAIRGVSDGVDDPLNLPGFPFQFFAYRHVAANNAAKVTLALLNDWPGPTADDSSEQQEPVAGPESALPTTGASMGAAALIAMAFGLAGRRRA